MDIEKASEEPGSTTEPGIAVRSESFPKTSEAKPMGKEIDDFGCNNDILDTAVPDRLQGLKLYSLTLAMCLSVFLSSLETTIVSTSLVTIVNNLKGYSKGSWIITAYLLTYTCFLILWAKASDILGRKLCLSTAIVIFMVASGACGAAQTTTQLILFRAFQGMGGSGTMSLTFVVIPEMVPATKYALYGSLTSFTFALAYLLGPLIGGVINERTTWRWVFLLNLPAGAIALVLLMFAMPSRFPYSSARNVSKKVLSKALLSKVDYLGFMLLLTACAFLIVALEESGIQYAWSDPLPIAFLVVSGLLWIGFFAWERVVSGNGHTQEPVFAWHFVKNKVFLGVLSIDFLAGVPFFVTIIQIPQRFQVVNGASTLEAGVRMLPFILGVPISTGLASISASKLKIPIIFLFALGWILQTVGITLMSTLPVEVSPRTYGFEAILGIGLGLNIGSVIIITPNLFQDKHQSVAMAAITQFRALGGVVGLAIAANVLNNHVEAALSVVLTPAQLRALLQTSAATGTLPESLQVVVRETFSDGSSLQMRVMIGFGAAQILSLILMWERKLRRVA